MKPETPIFSSGQLEAICKALGDTETGLTGSEIGHTLGQIGVADPESAATKWKRLYAALADRQNRDGSGDRVLAFVHVALEPSRYAGNQQAFRLRRDAVNVPLAFCGLRYGEDGRFRRCAPAATLSEAEMRAGRLRFLLEQRDIDPEVLSFCRAELLQDNYFHAVLEATKSVAGRIRILTGLTTDGAELAPAGLGRHKPALAHQRLHD